MQRVPNAHILRSKLADWLTFYPLPAWDNVTITLNQADASFGKNVQLTGASGSFSTSDNGKTWTGSVKIDADHFPAK